MPDPMLAVGDGDEADGVVSYDGRRARRDRNNEAVIRACWELFAQGEMYPTAQQVAEQSGVSLRSVFRHFQNLEALVATAAEAYYVSNVGVFTPPQVDPSAPLEERIDAMVAYRVQMYPVTGVVMRGAIARGVSDPKLAQVVEASRRRAIDVALSVFAPEIEAAAPERRAVLVAALHTATMFETWDNLANLHGLDAEQIADVYRGLLRGALGMA